MKYWRGYLVAAIFAAITWALTQFAQAHTVLVDMVYPYISRLIVTSMAEWTGSMDIILWQVLLIIAIVTVLVTVVLMILLRWNPIQWFGWVLAAISCVVFLNTAVFGLNQYASPLADDVRLSITDYTVSELNEATVFFRDKANELATKVARDDKGDPRIESFEAVADQAGSGFDSLTYDEAISVFAGSTANVKKQSWFKSKGDTGMTVHLTGESVVNPNVPNACLPFAMCKEMAHRMSIYSDADAQFAAILACRANESELFQYSAYLMAYHYCYEALASIPTSTAQACAKQTASGVNQLLKNDLEDCLKFFGSEDTSETNLANERTSTSDGEISIVTFSSYSTVTDLLASWYIQEYIVPLHREEEAPFDPYDPSQVDLSGLVNANTN